MSIYYGGFNIDICLQADTASRISHANKTDNSIIVCNKSSCAFHIAQYALNRVIYPKTQARNIADVSFDLWLHHPGDSTVSSCVFTVKKKFRYKIKPVKITFVVWRHYLGSLLLLKILAERQTENTAEESEYDKWQRSSAGL